MASDWEHVLGATGAGLAIAYDQAISTELYRDRREAVPPGASVDPGDEPVVLPFSEV